MNRTRNPAKEAIPSNTLHAASTHRRHFWRASVLSPPRARPEAHGPVSCIRHAARTHACARRAAFPIQYSSRPPLSMLIHHLNRKPADGRPAYSYCAARNDFVAPDPSWTVPAAYHINGHRCICIGARGKLRTGPGGGDHDVICATGAGLDT
jgi:hypothetical protein